MLPHSLDCCTLRYGTLLLLLLLLCVLPSCSTTRRPARASHTCMLLLGRILATVDHRTARVACCLLRLLCLLRVPKIVLLGMCLADELVSRIILALQGLLLMYKLLRNVLALVTHLLQTVI